MRAIILSVALVPLAACSETQTSEEEAYFDEIADSSYEAEESSEGDPDLHSFMGANSGSYGSGSGYRYYEDEEDREPFDEYAARRAAERELSLEGYDYSYGCTDDCSGHEAGWQWRADNGYSTYGNSQSFAEGGYAFDEALERRVDEMRDDYDSGYDPDY